MKNVEMKESAVRHTANHVSFGLYLMIHGSEAHFRLLSAREFPGIRMKSIKMNRTAPNNKAWIQARRKIGIKFMRMI
ncbi:hypothetical protein DWY25_08100 [Holdemania filiformis]|uniref:Uncharacterized protein n=1 Tax=Holdemania filiformis TaxID=61171 RepID=A0A412G2R5_9FIRM|nr:hypothetical protein DWY25_08100 [Holdemania filiformis]